MHRQPAATANYHYRQLSLSSTIVIVNYHYRQPAATANYHVCGCMTKATPPAATAKQHVCEAGCDSPGFISQMVSKQFVIL